MAYYMVLPFSLALIKNSKGEILIGRTANSPKKPYPNYWDLPGGKLEEGESAEECIKREIMEELGVTTKVIRLCGVFHHTKGTMLPECISTIPSFAVCYEVEIEGKINATEQNDVHFASPDELKTLQLTPWTKHFVQDLL